VIPWGSSYSQSDSVLLSVESPKFLLIEYNIIIPENGTYIQDKYTRFKNQYRLESRKVISSNESGTSNTNYEELKKSDSIKFITVHHCDSFVNIIRNSAVSTKLRKQIDSITRESIGYDNKDFQEFYSANRPPWKSVYQTCHAEYKVMIRNLKQELQSQIMSIYDGKQKRYSWIRANHASINQDYIDSFMLTCDAAEPDYRSIDLIIKHHPDLFVSAINKLSEIDFYRLTLGLESFPTDIDLTKTIQSLKLTSSKGARKRKVINKMKNNEG